MSEAEVLFEKAHGEHAILWCKDYFYNKIADPLKSHFPDWAVPREIQEVQRGIEQVHRVFSGNISSLALSEWLSRLQKIDASFFKQIMLLYRRHRAAETERFLEKTFNLELTEKLEQERKALDALMNSSEFLNIPDYQIPRLKDFLPVQLVEAAALSQVPFPARQFDEKFHILQAPGLFLQDLAYFRSKCDDRGTPLSVGFIDIDNFKALNTTHGHSKVDRNLLPRFMQEIEAHFFQHGFAYRQGGEEYLVLVPSLSKELSIAFLDELRIKIAKLTYPEIAEKITVSIGLCVATPGCPLTDRELRERANLAEEFAKKNGKNRIATYRTDRLVADELEVVKS